jgi:hypothetical protein
MPSSERIGSFIRFVIVVARDEKKDEWPFVLAHGTIGNTLVLLLLQPYHT